VGTTTYPLRKAGEFAYGMAKSAYENPSEAFSNLAFPVTSSIGQISDINAKLNEAKQKGDTATYNKLLPMLAMAGVGAIPFMGGEGKIAEESIAKTATEDATSLAKKELTAPTETMGAASSPMPIAPSEDKLYPANPKGEAPFTDPLTQSYAAVGNVKTWQDKFNNPPPPENVRSSITDVVDQGIYSSNGASAKLPTQLGLGTPYLMDSGATVAEGQKPLFSLTTTNANAPQQIANIDKITQKYPQMALDPQQWSQAMAEAYASKTVPIAPFNFMKGMQDGTFTNMLRDMTPGQVEMRRQGLANGKEFLNAYTSGEVGVETTGKLFMWGILSRGVNPYTHEGLFIDSFNGVEPYIKAASDGKFANVADSYRDWATTTAPKGSGQPGAGAMHNLNAFGEDFLTKMSVPSEDGVTPLQKLHDLMSDPTKSGRDIRREFAKMGEGVGIDNKVMSFILLATGRDDVMVIDRIQLDNLFNDGRFDNMNIWDGMSVPGVELPAFERKTPEGNLSQPKRTIKFSPTDEGRATAAQFLESSPGASSKKIAVTGSSLAEMTYGAKGLLTYESLENALASKIHDLYTAAGRPEDASVGGWHWDTWVAKSNQEASHGSLEALLKEAKGSENPLEGVYSRQGDYQTYAYGAKYFKGKNGPYFLMPLSDGSEVHLSVSEMNRLQKDMQDVTKGAVPVPTPYVVHPQTGKVTEFANTPAGRAEANQFAGKLTEESRSNAVAANPNLQQPQISAIKVPVRDRKFSVTSIEGKPWYEDQSINRERVDKLINDAAQRTSESEAATAKPSQSAVSNVTGKSDDAISRARNATGFDNGLPSTYGRVDGRAERILVGQNPPQFNAPTANVYQINPKAAVEYQKAGHSTPPIYELNTSKETSNASAQAFYDAIKKSKEKNPYGAVVYVYDSKECAKNETFYGS
jgi:hypothetical protein